jgi:hypothetical protein
MANYISTGAISELSTEARLAVVKVMWDCARLATASPRLKRFRSPGL